MTTSTDMTFDKAMLMLHKFRVINFELMGSILHDLVRVDFFNCQIHYAECVRFDCGVGPEGQWKSLRSVKVVPNLKVIVPMMKAGVQGWTLRENFPNLFQLELQ